MLRVPVHAPPILALGDTCRIYVMLEENSAYVPKALAVNPSGIEINITSYVQAISDVPGVRSLSFYVINFTPDAFGDWLIYCQFTDPADPSVFFYGECSIGVRQWATNMDKPVSQIMRQRVDIDRLRTNIRNQGGR